MRQAIAFLTFLSLSIFSFGQCFPDRHNGTWYDSWLSCETSQNPNTQRGVGHWIQYDLGYDYLLGAVDIWNINEPGQLERGAQEIAIDLSMDGQNWTEFGLFNVPMADGSSIYEGYYLTDMDGAMARYVLITVLSSHGAVCHGFSELRIGVDGVVTDIEESLNTSACFDMTVFPNPHRDVLNVRMDGHCGGVVDMRLMDALGRTVWQRTDIEPTTGSVLTIDNSALPAGVYFLQVGQGDALGRYQVVKTD